MSDLVANPAGSVEYAENVKVTWYPAITLDGFIADVQGDSDWVNEEDEQLFSDLVANCGCVVVGRTTFDQYRDVIYPVADTMTFVYSSCSLPNEDGVTFVNGTPANVLSEVARQGFSEVVLSGGGETSGSFAAAGLIDEAIISVYPRILGQGIPMLGSYKGKIDLVSSTSVQLIGGITQLRSKQVVFSTA